MTQSFLQSEDELSNVLFHFLPEATRESINATRNASHARLLEHLRGEFKDHYWDSLEKDKEILMKHIDALLSPNE